MSFKSLNHNDSQTDEVGLKTDHIFMVQDFLFHPIYSLKRFMWSGKGEGQAHTDSIKHHYTLFKILHW